LTISLENVAGNGAHQDTEAAELTVELSQSIELGGKRRLRREAADLGRQMAANEQLRTLADVQAITRQRYVAVLAAQERMALAREQAKLAEKSLNTAEERIKAGKAPLIDRLRLQGEASMARLTLAQVERSLVTAGQALATSWGEVQPDFDQVAGDLAILPAVPALSDVEATLEQAPDAVNRRITLELHGNELAQARAKRIPDPSLTVGWRQFEESDDNALVFGLSVPLPLFNQGQDEVAAASRRVNSAMARELSARTRAQATLRTAWQALADARAEAEVLSSQVVPAATEGFAAAELGYQAGKFGLIEILDAQRALFEARHRQLAARMACHLASIELLRLQGTDTGAAPP
jgi:cobalt-zinc-cadmium efflux system outer membrane protein